jgi:hypothetical protein
VEHFERSALAGLASVCASGTHVFMIRRSLF